MAPQPQGLIGDISDDELDRAVSEQFDADDQPTTPEAPADSTAGPSEDVPSSDDNQSPDSTDKAPAGDETPATDVAAQASADAIPPASAPAAPATAAKPFQFNASGGVQSLPYARELPDGSVAIPKEAVSTFRQQMASAHEATTNFRRAKRDFDRQLTEARTQRTAKDAEADAVIGLMTDLLRATPEQQAAYLTSFQGNIPQLTLDLERRKLDEERKRFEQQQRGPQLSPEEQQEQTAELAGQEFGAEWNQLLAANHPDLAYLTDAERDTIRGRWAKKADRLVRTIRTSEEAQRLGGKVGDSYFDPAEFYEDLNFVIGLKKQAAPAKPSNAAQVNARRNADQQPSQTRNAIPPTPKAQVPTGQPRQRNGQFKAAAGAGRKGFKEYLMSTEDEDE